jgi:hypothetical protein
MHAYHATATPGSGPALAGRVALCGRVVLLSAASLTREGMDGHTPQHTATSHARNSHAFENDRSTTLLYEQSLLRSS